MRRGWVVAAAVAVVLLAGGVTFALTRGGDRSGVTAPTGAPGTTGPSPTTGPTGNTGTTGPTGTASPSPAALEDGEHFGFVQSVDAAGGTLVFDLAYFLTGQEANEAAEEHGDEVPPPNDYYIVNDNPKLRTLALAPGVELDLLDWTNCCDERFEGDLEAFADAFEQGGTVEADGFVYQGPLSPYWLTVEGGVVVRIEEQYLP